MGEGKVVLADCSGQMCINELEEDIEDDIALKSIFINDLLLIYNKTPPQQFAAKASYQGVNNCNYGNIVFPPPDILFVPQRATEFSLQVKKCSTQPRVFGLLKHKLCILKGHKNFKSERDYRCFLVLQKPAFIGYLLLLCGYCSVSCQSFVFTSFGD